MEEFKRGRVSREMQKKLIEKYVGKKVLVKNISNKFVHSDTPRVIRRLNDQWAYVMIAGDNHLVEPVLNPTLDDWYHVDWEFAGVSTHQMCFPEGDL